LTTFDVCRLISSSAGTVTTLSVKIHLVSPFLGPACYIGSSTSPIVIPLTTGATNPPPPIRPIEGKGVEFLHKTAAGVEQSLGLRLVSNTFSVPVATGCGTSAGKLLNASIDQKLGLPTPAGKNAMVINTTGELVAPHVVLENGWTHE
jgi:hypothetical protein